MNKHKIGIIVLILATTCFGTLGVWGKVAFKVGLTPLKLMSLRFSFAAVIMWIIGFLFFKKKLGVNKKDLLFLIIQGGILYATTAVAFFTSLETLKVSLATVLFFLHPLYTYFISSYLLKERISKLKWLALLTTLIGVILVVELGSLGGNVSIIGIAYAISGGFVYSIFNINNHCYKYKKSINSYTSTMYIISFAAISLNIFSGLKIDSLISLTYEQVLVVLGISIIGTILGIVGYIAGIKIVGATTASIVSVFEPLSGVIFAFIFLSESISSVQVVGIAIILLSIVLIAKEKQEVSSIVDLIEF